MSTTQVPVGALGESDIGNTRRILAKQVDVWVQDSGVDCLVILRGHCEQTWQHQPV